MGEPIRADPEALVALAAAWERFSNHALEALRSVEDELRRRLEQLDASEESMLRRLRRWEEETRGSTDAESRSRAAFRVRCLEERLGNLQGRLRRLEEAREEYRRAASQLEELISDRAARARDFLDAKVHWLREYLQLELPDL